MTDPLHLDAAERARREQRAESASATPSTAPGEKGLYLRSPNGTRYQVTVTNAGALTVTPAP